MTDNTRSKGIIAYGTAEDRKKLAALSRFENSRSSSETLIRMIRDRFKEVAGETPPDEFATHQK